MSLDPSTLALGYDFCSWHEPDMPGRSDDVCC